MRYLIQSQNAENLQKALAYVESLGIEVSPLPEEPQPEAKPTFDFSSLCMRVPPEVSREIHEELERMRNE
ncbi:MAG: hypothetical protein EAZ95_05720 [Bacteroidetes bacterium]|nr:MAG: hypothetical protein EAZ95_05720 [Bacteroidota bacterium]